MPGSIGITVGPSARPRGINGRFMGSLKLAKAASLDDIAEVGVAAARAAAPSGPARRYGNRRPKLRTSIERKAAGPGMVRWGSNAQHAAPQDLGWTQDGEEHEGTGYMAESLAAVRLAQTAILRRHYGRI